MVYVAMVAMLFCAACWRMLTGSWPNAWVAITLAFPLTYMPSSRPIDGIRLYAGEAKVLSSRLLVDTAGQIWASHRKLPLNATLRVEAEVCDWDAHPIPIGFNAREVYGPKGAVGVMRIYALDSLGPLSGRAERLSSRWRDWLLRQPWPMELKGLGLALSVGDRRWLSSRWKVRFQHAGLAHVLALSGFHLGLLTLVFRWTQRWLPMPLRPWWLLIGALSTWGLVVMVGSASLIRAAVFLTAIQMVALLPFRMHVESVMHCAAALLILWRPQLTQQLGFQLSVIAVLAIVGSRVPKGKSWVAKLGSGMMVAWVAQMVTMPRTLAIFHQVPLHFLWTNVLLVPLALLIYPLLILACVGDALGWQMPIDGIIMEWVGWLFDLGSEVWTRRHPDIGLQCVMAVSALWMVIAVRQRRWKTFTLTVLISPVALWMSSPDEGQGQFAYRRGRGIAWIEYSEGRAEVHATKGLSANDWVWRHAFKAYWDATSVDSVRVVATPWIVLDSLFTHHQIPTEQGFHGLN